MCNLIYGIGMSPVMRVIHGQNMSAFGDDPVGLGLYNEQVNNIE